MDWFKSIRLLLLVIDWIMETPISKEKRGIKQVAWNQLEDLDSADDVTSYTQRWMKGISVGEASTPLGLDIHKEKRNILKYNT